jgi:hypothetical protein
LRRFNQPEGGREVHSGNPLQAHGTKAISLQLTSVTDSPNSNGMAAMSVEEIEVFQKAVRQVVYPGVLII